MLWIDAKALLQFSKLWGGRLFEGKRIFQEGAYIIALITHEIHRCKMQEFCNIYKNVFTIYLSSTCKIKANQNNEIGAPFEVLTLE